MGGGGGGGGGAQDNRHCPSTSIIVYAYIFEHSKPAIRWIICSRNKSHSSTVENANDSLHITGIGNGTVRANLDAL